MGDQTYNLHRIECLEAEVRKLRQALRILADEVASHSVGAHLYRLACEAQRILEQDDLINTLSTSVPDNADLRAADSSGILRLFEDTLPR